MRHKRIKITGAIALIVLLALQPIWLILLYRSSISNYQQQTDQCLKSAIDMELRGRLISLGKEHVSKFTPYTDTATYVHQLVETPDTSFYIYVNRNDPTVRPRVLQYMLNDFLPVNTAQLDVLFKRNMVENSLIVRDSYIELIDLKRNRIISHNAPEGKPNGYTESGLVVLDIIDTIGVKAYVNASVFSIMQPYLFWLILLVVLTIIETICLVWLLRNLLRYHKEKLKLMGFIKKMSYNIRKPIYTSTIKINDLSEQLNLGNVLTAVESAVEIETELNRVDFYIDEVLAIIHQEEHPAIFAKETVMLQPFFMLLKEQYELNSSKKVIVKVEVNEDVSLRINPIHFRNLIEALMSNAVRFSGDTVHILLKAFALDHFINISVLDDGWGIPEADQERIFHKFYKVKQHEERLGSKSLGMGLTYAATVTRAMGGGLYVESKENDFSEFYMIFSNDPEDDEASEYYDKLGVTRMYESKEEMRRYFSFMFDHYNWELVDLQVEPQEGHDDPCDPSIIRIAVKPLAGKSASSIPLSAFGYYYDVRFLKMEKDLWVFVLLKEDDPYRAEHFHSKYAKYMHRDNYLHIP